MPISDDADDFARSKPHLPYERHRPEPDKTAAQENQIPSLDPVRWQPVRHGLALVFGGWMTMLVVIGIFTAVWFGNIFFFKADIELIRDAAVVALAIGLLGGLTSFAGHCLCIAVPAAPWARVYAIGSVAAMLVAVVAVGALVYTVIFDPPPPVEEQLPKAEPPPDAEAPKAEAPKADAPDAQPPVPDDKDAAPAPVRKDDALVPGETVSKSIRRIALAAYLVGQILFVFFLKRVAIYFNDMFLAESTGGYLALLIFHTALVALLPAEAMIACFFWVIMLALQVVLMIWFLMLLAGTRRAIG